ncbi:MAG: FtsX-like permease family protein [Lachnospiraceae bacterium]
MCYYNRYCDGYSGVIGIFLEKRIKELAICKAVGGTDVEIAMELIFEIATICISGCVLGGMIGGGLTKWIIFGTKYQVLYHYKTIVILAMVGILLILVLAGPMISNISKLKITELLNASRR